MINNGYNGFGETCHRHWGGIERKRTAILPPADQAAAIPLDSIQALKGQAVAHL